MSLTLEQTDSLRVSLPLFGSNLAPQAYPLLSDYLDFYHFDVVTEQVNAHYQMGMLNIHSRRICIHHWQCPNALGTVFVVHGLFDHSGLYLHLIKTLVEQGYSVVSIDLPGHGLSEGAAAEIGDFDEYAQVIAECSHYFQTLAPQPFAIVGQSTGGAAILKQLFNTPSTSPFVQATLLAPLIKPSQWPIVATSYYLFKPFMQKVPRGFQENSHDPNFNKFLRHQDPLQCRHISVRWVGAMVSWVKTFPTMPILNHPLTIIQGSADNTVHWRWNIKQIQQHFPQVEVHMIDGAMHHLSNEATHWREQVFQRIVESLPSHRCSA